MQFQIIGKRFLRELSISNTDYSSFFTVRQSLKTKITKQEKSMKDCNFLHKSLNYVAKIQLIKQRRRENKTVKEDTLHLHWAFNWILFFPNKTHLILLCTSHDD